MNISMLWLKQYLGEAPDPKEASVILTDLGLEVDASRPLGDQLEKIVAGKILTMEKHPNADKLTICSIDAGEQEPLSIITGADNIRAGMNVPVALVGAKVIGGEIRLSKLRGLPSYGMLCSGEELGIDSALLPEEARNGILPLGEDVLPGTDVKAYLGLDDHILELGLTPNRADCYGIYNVARELILKKDYALKPLEVLPATQNEEEIQIEIADQHLCHRYIGRIIEDVKVGPSPVWFANLLRNVGIRPISNVVDITNYVMFETGHPMHAFDLEQIRGSRILVQRAAKGEILRTLDGQDRELDGEMLTIRDQEGPIALAGVMGGLATEVTEGTSRVLLEAAHFNSASIRKTSRRLGLRSEASGRYERGLSEENVAIAMERAAYLMEALGVGRPREAAADNYPARQAIPEITCRPGRISRLLGMTVPKEEMEGIFRRLGFHTVTQGDVLQVKPLPHRIDIQGETDLMEEVVRVYGYDKIPATLPVGATNTLRREEPLILQEKVKSLMAHQGLAEIITYSFVDPGSYERCRLDIAPDVRLKVLNPLSETQSIMRESLLPGILEAASRNYKRQIRDIKLFEAGRIYKGRAEGLPEERLTLGVFLLENKQKEWQGTTLNDFYSLKGVLETLLSSLSLNEWVLIPRQDAGTFHPGRCGMISIDGAAVGMIGEIHPKVLEEYDIREKAYYLEVDLSSLSLPKVPVYAPLPRFPFVERDMALMVPREIRYDQLEAVIRHNGGDKLISARLFDVYEGSQIREGMKSMAIALTYLDREKTLTDEEVGAIHDRILQALEQELGATLR